jgi:hypothetical protein
MRRARSGNWRNLLVLAAVNVLIIGLLTALSPTFLSYGNLSAVMLRMSELAMLAIAETIVLIAGGFDLTIGAVLALSATVFGTLHVAGLPFPTILALALLAGIAVGLLNGFLVVALRLHLSSPNDHVRRTQRGLRPARAMSQRCRRLLNQGYVYVLKIRCCSGGVRWPLASCFCAGPWSGGRS